MSRPVMVVEDDEDIRDVVAMALSDSGYRVVTAFDGLDAVEKIRAGLRPSAIVLDMMMPRMDGEAFIRWLRCEPGLGETPIALLSGHAQVRSIARSLGIPVWLTKPIELEDLIRTVARLSAPVAGPREQHP